MAAEFLQMRGIVKHYGRSPVLRAVNFSAEMGEVHALVGENGAGKSTLMKILAGGLRCDGGEISIANEVVAINDPRDAQRLRISAVYQEFSLIPHLFLHFPHGFIAKTVVMPANFCELGITRFETDLERFSYIRQEILESLGRAIECSGDWRVVCPPSRRDVWGVSL
jgi:ABC-type branched-subunit amino acid transport system ATPase component